MVIERFSQNVLNSGLFRLYIATGFFATLIFFVINSELFTPMEIVVWIVSITIFLKGVSNIMFSLLILLFSLDNKRTELEYKYNEEKIDAMLNELNIKEIIELNKKQKEESSNKE